MSSAVFRYDLTLAEFMVYSYLVCCAGQKNMCWPSVHRIAVNCSCSENTICKAIAALVKKRFIRRVATYEDWEDGHSRQTNNTYSILDLPPVQSAIDGRLGMPEDRLSALQFNNSVELDMPVQIIAHAYKFNGTALRKLRSDSVKKVKPTNGRVSLANAVRERDEAEWQD